MLSRYYTEKFQFSECAELDEVLRHITEKNLMAKISSIPLFGFDEEYVEELNIPISELFERNGEYLEDRGIKNIDELTSYILPNAPKEIRDMLQVLQFELIEPEWVQDVKDYWEKNFN